MVCLVLQFLEFLEFGFVYIVSFRGFWKLDLCEPSMTVAFFSILFLGIFLILGIYGILGVFF